jgi:triacylglycerol lipase
LALRLFQVPAWSRVAIHGSVKVVSRRLPSFWLSQNLGPRSAEREAEISEPFQKTVAAAKFVDKNGLENQGAFGQQTGNEESQAPCGPEKRTSGRQFTLEFVFADSPDCKGVLCLKALNTIHNMAIFKFTLSYIESLGIQNLLRMATLVFVWQFVYSASGVTLAQEDVILLHGAIRTTNSMSRIERALTIAGYKVHNLDYSTHNGTISTISDEVIGGAIASCERDGAKRIHFVTHSMGGILVRSYLKRHTIPSLGRVVMLGPPNQGSELADDLASFCIIKARYHTAVLELTTGTNSTACALGPATFCLGVIAGDRSINPLFSFLIPGSDDGMVAVNRTKITGMADHIVIHTTHTFMVYHQTVIKQIVFFLQHGQFERDPYSQVKKLDPPGNLKYDRYDMTHYAESKYRSEAELAARIDESNAKVAFISRALGLRSSLPSSSRTQQSNQMQANPT